LGSAFWGGLCCCSGRGEKGEIVTFRVGRFVTFISSICGVECLFGEIFGDVGLEVQVWLGLEEGVLRPGRRGLEYFLRRAL
jgi:hypothetical protein